MSQKMLIPVDVYAEYLRQMNITENTIVSYKGDLNHFNRWLVISGKSELNQVTSRDIEKYMSALKKQKLSVATVSRRLTSIRQFFKWALNSALVYIDPTGNIRSLKVIKKTPYIATNSEIQKLIDTCDKTTPKGQRDRAMLIIINMTGLRVSELLQLKVSDFDKKGRRLLISERDNHSVRLGKKAYQALNQYVEIARPKLLLKEKKVEQLFLNLRGDALSRQGFWKILKKSAHDAGIANQITPETLHHNFAVNALLNGENHGQLQKKLGHSTLSSVTEYAVLASKIQQ